MASEHQLQKGEQPQRQSHAPGKPKEYGVPQPPSIQRLLLFKKTQLIGVPLIILIPVLALLGVFGESFETTRQTGDTFAVEITYPARFRYKMIDTMMVTVENVSAQAVPTVTVAFDAAYISQFSTVSFTPSVSEIAGDAYYVQLKQVEAGEVRRVVVTLQAERYWRHEGEVTVAPGGKDASADLTFTFNTLVYP